MARRDAEVLIQSPVNAGMKRLYGMAGDSLNSVIEVIRKSKKVDWLRVRHEEAAAFAASPEAHLTRKLAVCAGTCRSRNLQLINGLFDCQRSCVPVLAIAAQIPRQGIGTRYSQETNPQRLFQDCSHRCEMVSQPDQFGPPSSVPSNTMGPRRGTSS
jgi:pyruvate dehydrogenase (quinone)